MTDPTRDRDEAGRARSARPRDALGRPLPYDAPGEPRAPEGVVRTPAETLHEAQELLDAGRPFHAHEVLEASWKDAAGPERALWQGLAQLCVGLTHLARGNPRGAEALLRRSGERIAAYAAHPPHGIAAGALAGWAAVAADAAAAGGTPPEPLPRLTSG